MLLNLWECLSTWRSKLHSAYLIWEHRAIHALLLLVDPGLLHLVFLLLLVLLVVRIEVFYTFKALYLHTDHKIDCWFVVWSIHHLLSISSPINKLIFGWFEQVNWLLQHLLSLLLFHFVVYGTCLLSTLVDHLFLLGSGFLLLTADSEGFLFKDNFVLLVEIDVTILEHKLGD